MQRRLVAEQLVEVFPGFGRPIRFGLLASKFPLRHFKPFAEVRHVLLRHRIGAAIAALLGDARIIADAVLANTQIAPAFFAGFTPARLAI